MNSASSPKVSSINNIQLLLQIQIALVGIILVAGLFFLWKATTRVDEKLDLLAFQIKKHIMSVAQNNASPSPGDNFANFIDNMMAAGGLPTHVPPEILAKQAQAQQAEQVNQYNRSFVKPNDNNVNSVNDVNDDDSDDSDDDEDEVLNSGATTFVLFTSQQPQFQRHQQFSEEPKIEDITEESQVQSQASKPEIKPVSKPKSVDDSEETESSDHKKELTNPLSKSKLQLMKVEDLKQLCSDRGLSTDGHKPDLINRLLGISRD
jgi:hypothetical protein